MHTNTFFLFTVVLTLLSACSNTGGHGDQIDHDALHGEWFISEIHVRGTDDDLIPSFTRLDSGPGYPTLNYFRPTLGDSARLSVSWNCNAFGFSFNSSDDVLMRLTEVLGPGGPWTTSVSGSSITTRFVCGAPEYSNPVEIDSVLSKLAELFVGYQEYELILLGSSTVSLFTAGGDGIFAFRM